jgi:predicted metal-dependent hydrolase
MDGHLHYLRVNYSANLAHLMGTLIMVMLNNVSVRQIHLGNQHQQLPNVLLKKIILIVFALEQFTMDMQNALMKESQLDLVR